MEAIERLCRVPSTPFRIRNFLDSKLPLPWLDFLLFFRPFGQMSQCLPSTSFGIHSSLMTLQIDVIEQKITSDYDSSKEAGKLLAFILCDSVHVWKEMHLKINWLINYKLIRFAVIEKDVLVVGNCSPRDIIMILWSQTVYYRVYKSLLLNHFSACRNWSTPAHPNLPKMHFYINIKYTRHVQ